MSAGVALPQLPQTLRTSRWQWFLLLLGAVIFGVVDFPGSWKDIANWSWSEWLAITIFGTCLLCALINLLPGAGYLRLEAQGMEVSYLYRTHSTPWSDIAGFGVMVLPRTGRELVGWNYMPGKGKPSMLCEFDFAVYGLEVALPDTYGMDARDLAALLQSVRDRQTGSATTT